MSVGLPPFCGSCFHGCQRWLWRSDFDPQCPGAGDALLLDRLALHAHRLELAHPITGAPLDLVSPLPHDLEHVCEVACR